MTTAQPLGLPRLPDLEPLPRYALLGHLRPRERYTVRVVGREERGASVLTRYLVSAAAYRGEEVAVHVAVCIRNPADRGIVLSVPGGRGAFDEATLCWLADHFGANYAAVDWIGRGRSPAHLHMRCDYDPIYMADDDIRTSFMFHNLAAIWAAADWLFGEGYAVDVAGGSWGGVYSFLLAALEPRLARIFPTFGCGGMSFPGVEKRSMWDAAIEAMGPQRTRRWSEAFDPLLRIGDVAAAVHYDTATNDKFFSLEMAMATWSRVAAPNFLSVIANQDHMTRPFGAQPYLVQRLSDAALAPCRALTRPQIDADPRSGEIRCFPVADDDTDIRLIWSEQDARHGNMSREWFSAAPREIADGAAIFSLAPTDKRSTILFYLNRIATIDGHQVNASTPIRSLDPDESRAASAVPRTTTLLDTQAADLVSAPFEDRSGPAVTAAEGGWEIRFAGHGALARASRWGIRPWLLPDGWQTIEVVLREPVPAEIGALGLYLSRRYQRLDEEAVAQPFAKAEAVGDGGLRRYRFARDRFVPAVVVEQRFRRHMLPAAADILDAFDAVGAIDFNGRAVVSFVLVAITIG